MSSRPVLSNPLTTRRISSDRISTNRTVRRPTRIVRYVPSRSARCRSSASRNRASALNFRRVSPRIASRDGQTITRHHCALRSRNGHTFKHWPQLCEKLAHAVKPHNAIIDGAIACLDKRGRSTSRICCFAESGHSSTPSTCSPLMGKKTSGTGRSSSASGDCAS